jgi:glycosyltransferase involved in cell wall biosynthesis
VREPRRGQASAKNAGIARARGEFIAFLDADDLWVPDKLEAQMPLFDDAATSIVYARMVHMDEHGRDGRVTDYPLHRGRITGHLLVFNFVAFGTTVARRACFERLGGFRESLRMGIDYDLWLRLSTECRFDYVDRPLLRYRVWPGQMSNDCTGRMLTGIQIMRRFLADHPGEVDPDTERVAWAHTYVGLGDCLRRNGGPLRSVLSTYARALRYKPTYAPGWKAVVKALVA